MSKDIPMYAVDTVRMTVQLDARIYQKAKNKAEAVGVSVNSIINALLFEDMKNDPWTVADEKKVTALIDKNIKAREQKKAKSRGATK